MSKLNWSRAAFWVVDPARVLKIDDIFVTPDKTVNAKSKRTGISKPPTPAQTKRKLARNARSISAHANRLKRRAQERAKNEEVKTAQLAKIELERVAAAARKLTKKESQKAKADARRAAFLEYKKTSEYAEKTAKQKAEMDAKKKSHLQVWIEERTQLNGDRETLRQRWRKLLMPNTDDEVINDRNQD